MTNKKNVLVFGVVFTLTALLLMFAHINFDPQVGSIFTLFLVIGFALTILNKKIDLPIVRATVQPLQIILFSVGGYFTFLLASTFVLPFAGINVQFSLENLAAIFSENIVFFTQAQAEPVLAGNPFLIQIAWGILIPITETIVFVLAYEKFLDFVGKKPDLKKSISYVAIALISIVFALFHLTAKGGEPDASLMMTGLFMAVSLIVATFRKQQVEAILMHIIANSFAIALTLNIGFTAPIIITAMAVGLFIILSNKNIQRTIS